MQLREGKRRHVTNWRNESWPGVVFVLRANCAQNQTSFQRFQTLTSMLSNSCQQVSLCICVGKNQTSQMVANFSTCDLTAAPLISLSLNIWMAPKLLPECISTKDYLISTFKPSTHNTMSSFLDWTITFLSNILCVNDLTDVHYFCIKKLKSKG